MSEELYLILHKVRGEPAFDVAQQLVFGNELMWIIPTSGHRAYPYVYMRLDQCHYLSSVSSIPDNAPPIPSEWPDHYSIHAAASKHTIKQLLAAIGITPPTLKRRKISC